MKTLVKQEQSKNGKFCYGVLDKLMGGYQVSDDEFFDTITECVAAIMTRDDLYKKYWKQFEVYQCMDDEGDYHHVVLRLQYRHKDLCVY